MRISPTSARAGDATAAARTRNNATRARRGADDRMEVSLTVGCFLLRPAQHERVEALGELDEAGARGGVHGEERIAPRVRGDDAALLHQHLAGGKAALPVLVVDE